MKLPGYLLMGAALLLTLPACDQSPSGNQRDGVQDAFDARPNEGLRDAAEDVQESVEDAGRDMKEAVREN